MVSKNAKAKCESVEVSSKREGKGTHLRRDQTRQNGEEEDDPVESPSGLPGDGEVEDRGHDGLAVGNDPRSLTEVGEDERDVGERETESDASGGERAEVGEDGLTSGDGEQDSGESVVVLSSDEVWGREGGRVRNEERQRARAKQTHTSQPDWDRKRGRSPGRQRC